MVNKYLLDTCVVISFLRGKEGMGDKILSVGLNNCAISELTLAQLYSGPYRVMQNSGCDSLEYKRAKLQLESLEEVRRIFTVLPLAGFAESFAQEHERLRADGRMIEDIDLLIGSFAKSNGFTLVTGNVKRFERINGLTIDNWFDMLSR